MYPLLPLTWLNQPLAWLPFHICLSLIVATCLLSRRRALPLPIGLTNALHVGLAVAAWLVPVAGRDYLGWAAVGSVAVTLALLICDRGPAPTTGFFPTTKPS